MNYGKINHKKVEIDGYVFDSETEALFYQELKKDPFVDKFSIIVHPKYELQPQFTDSDGNKRKPINYYADFEYQVIAIHAPCDDLRSSYLSFGKHVVDIKGWLGQDNAFPLHWKMFDYQHKGELCLEVLKYSKTTGFVPYADYKEIMKSKRSQLIAEKNGYKGDLERIRWLNDKLSKLPKTSALRTRYEAELANLMKGDGK